MRAFGFETHGGVEVLKPLELARPRPRRGEALIQVVACGLNHLDLWVRGGLPGLNLPKPHVLGGDIAGVIAEVGEGVTLPLGARVLLNPGLSCGACAACLAGRDNLCPDYQIFGEHLWGGNAEYVRAPLANIIPLPERLSFEEAAALPIPLITAWQMVRKAQLRPGDPVLVQGGASGVGVYLIQIARLFGARVAATASAPHKRAALEALGATVTLDSGLPDLAQAVKAGLGARGVEAVFEHVGTATWAQSVRALAYGGRLVTCGATTGHDARIDLRLLFWKQLQLLGSTMGSKADLLEAVAAVSRGAIKPVIDSVMPMSEVASAHQRMAARAHLGKIVLRW
ncbi:zinc-binding dehydrogenase [Myxococcota bacterium]|nr:zinc-binding dehydrogenase [Myxococcota bacterium]MBU1429243.1 zinc-binding dehydrogenase [Myxococcota bacterium]MBU1897990.1 zinc-binding dehydrogenase [Myxococcota bacterium]